VPLSPTDDRITVPATALGALRGAFEELLTGCIEDMAMAARGPALAAALSEFDTARSLLDDVGWEAREPEADVELDLGHGRDCSVVKALCDHLDTQRDLADTQDECQRCRAETAASSLELLLTVIER
jgi:hypothetical protein